jgi:hypothetical protein
MTQFNEDWQRYSLTRKGMALVAYLPGARECVYSEPVQRTECPGISSIVARRPRLSKIPFRCALTHRSLWARVAVLQGDRAQALVELGRCATNTNSGARGSRPSRPRVGLRGE